MGAAEDVATKAASNLMNADPVIGSIAVLLALALIVVVVVSWRRDLKKDETIARLQTEAVAREAAFRQELSGVQNGVFKAISSIDTLSQLLTQWVK